MNANKLKGKVIALGMEVEDLADIMDCDRSTVYRKLKNFEKITIGDALKIKAGLNLTNAEAVDIFLS